MLRQVKLRKYYIFRKNMTQHFIIVGKRMSGRSSFISSLIGTGDDTLVIVETDSDMQHHTYHSPKATVVYKDQVANLEIFACIALDNVIFDPEDPLLNLLFDSDDKTIILCVSHPNSVPTWYNGPITYLSYYKGTSLTATPCN
jgi:hypothetical protein